MHDLLPQEDPVPWVPYKFSSPRGPNVIVFPGGGEEAEAEGRENHGDLGREPSPLITTTNNLRTAGERACILTPVLPLYAWVTG